MASGYTVFLSAKRSRVTSSTQLRLLHLVVAVGPRQTKIDGEALVKALLAYKRGEPRVCAMLRVPTPEEEDRRRLVRERKALINERIRHVNRI
jgi:transposase